MIASPISSARRSVTVIAATITSITSTTRCLRRTPRVHRRGDHNADPVPIGQQPHRHAVIEPRQIHSSMARDCLRHHLDDMPESPCGVSQSSQQPVCLVCEASCAEHGVPAYKRAAERPLRNLLASVWGWGSTLCFSSITPAPTLRNSIAEEAFFLFSGNHHTSGRCVRYRSTSAASTL